jgi:hypothetical protein
MGSYLDKRLSMDCYLNLKNITEELLLISPELAYDPRSGL